MSQARLTAFDTDQHASADEESRLELAKRGRLSQNNR